MVNLVQDYPSYILKAHGLYSTTLAYPKWLYVFLKVNILYNIILLEPTTLFSYDMWSCDTKSYHVTVW